jgi:phosphoenolpyruvate synthase/pyruvate phosphate dikinase
MVCPVNILWLDEKKCQNPKIAGGKASALSRLAPRYPVPPGFCVTAEASDDSIAQAYEKLGEKCGIKNPAVALRSSVADEDGMEASFAGQYETYLNMVGAGGVIEAARRCFESAGSDRVAAYRAIRGKKADSVNIAVLVQQLIKADVSAVVFSVNPVDGNEKEIIINSAWGLGESITSGTLVPDAYRISKPGLEIKERRGAVKTRMTIPDPEGSGIIEAAVPRMMAEHLTMTDKMAVQTAGLSLELEKESGFPVDVECAWKDEELYLLQCRPVTAL